MDDPTPHATDDLVLYDVVCTVTLYNPARHDAWSRDMEHRYFDLLDQASAGNPDFAEGVASFVEKRPPSFAPLPADSDLPPLLLFALQG